MERFRCVYNGRLLVVVASFEANAAATSRQLWGTMQWLAKWDGCGGRQWLQSYTVVQLPNCAVLFLDDLSLIWQEHYQRLNSCTVVQLLILDVEQSHSCSVVLFDYPMQSSNYLMVVMLH